MTRLSLLSDRSVLLNCGLADRPLERLGISPRDSSPQCLGWILGAVVLDDKHGQRHYEAPQPSDTTGT